MEQQIVKNFIKGKWYLCKDIKGTALKYNGNYDCTGYWEKLDEHDKEAWGVDEWSFDTEDKWVEATKKDLYKLGNEWEKYWDEEDAKEVKQVIRQFETGSKRDDDSDKPLVNHLDAYVRLRFGYLLRQGANKYDKGNWRKLQPTEVALESLHRHLAKYELNLQNGVEQDEDHLSAIIFNVMLIMKQEEKDGISVEHFFGTMK